MAPTIWPPRMARLTFTAGRHFTSPLRITKTPAGTALNPKADAPVLVARAAAAATSDSGHRHHRDAVSLNGIAEDAACPEGILSLGEDELRVHISTSRWELCKKRAC